MESGSLSGEYRLVSSCIHSSLWYVVSANVNPKQHDQLESGEWQSSEGVVSVPQSFARDEILGMIGVYVDDFLFCMCADLLNRLYQRIVKQWKVSALSWLTHTEPLVFCGTTMILTDAAVILHQRAFAVEFLAKHHGQYGGRGRNT
eukprot:6492612-Amphidinium_carterae.2